MFITPEILFSLVGIVGGTFMGLIGTGIGPIVVPALIIFLPSIGVGKEISVHIAVATSLAIIVFTAAISSIFHFKNKTVDLTLLYRLLPGSLVGGILGTSLLLVLPVQLLKLLFGVLLFLLGIRMCFNIKERILPNLPSRKSIFLYSMLMAIVSNILGVSDGILIVPFLIKYKVPLRVAIGTSIVLVFIISFIGIFTFLINSMFAQHLPQSCFGFIYLPALFFIGLTSSLFSVIALVLSKKISENILKIVFGLMMLSFSAKILFS